ncbi:alpha/beta fold hydrolase [Pelagibacterium limicola]|uniref:alpha/beta fold hydrolase n=1 Tax=Pelagibacterium limicola TaxID=2791022 RepID=UPI0018AF70A3|nr:hypothetical protein [Pelagibacterium limicola]
MGDVPRVPTYLQPDAAEGFKASPAWPAFAAVGTTIVHDFTVLTEAQYGEGMGVRWSRIAQPVLVVDGDASFSFMAAGADMAAKALPNARRKTLAGQGHGPEPEVYAPVIREFLGG